MMQEEEEVVTKDDSSKPFENSKNADPSQDILPFTNFDVQNGSSKKYTFTPFEMFVTVAVMLSTISGGFLEGYTSAAFPSLLEISSQQQNLTWASASSLPVSSERTSASVGGTELRKESHNNSETTDNPSTEDTLLAKEGTMFETLRHENGTFANLSVAPENEVIPDLEEETSEMLPTPLAFVELDGGAEGNTTAPIKSSSLHITEEEGSWLASLLLLGAAVGAVVSPWLVRLGRRHAIIMSALPRFFGWLLVILSSSVYSIYAGRFLCGVSIGAVSSATPIYISEISHPSLRGSLSCVVILGVNLGIFIASLLGTFLEWRNLAVAGASTVVAYLVPFLCLPNSPSWLVLRGREDEARASLRKLRGRTYCVENELQQVISVTEMAKNKSLSWKEVLSERRTLLPLCVLLLVTAVNRFSGYNAIITYCSLFIHQAVPSVSQYWSAVSVCFVQILATLGAMALVDSWGRRKLLLSSVTVMGLSLVVIAACETVASVREGGTWIAVLAMMMYVGAYSIGVGPLTFVLLGELFPLDARDRATALVVVVNWALAFLVTKIYYSMEASIGLSGTCLIYATVCLAGVGFMFFLVPETRERTLSEIEAYFSYTQGFMWGPPSMGRLDQALSGILDTEGTPIDSYSTFH